MSLDILDLHEILLAEIQERVSKWTNKQMIGDIFVKHVSRTLDFKKINGTMRTNFDMIGRSIEIVHGLRQ